MLLQRVNIKNKVVFVIGLALLVFLAFAAGTIILGKRQLSTLEEIYADKIVPLDNLRKIQLNFREIEYRMAAVVADVVAPIGSGEHIKQSAAEIDRLWADAKKRIDANALKKEITDFEKGLAGFKDLAPKLQEAYFSEDVKKVSDLINEFFDYKPLLYKSVDAMAKHQEESVKVFNLERTKAVSRINGLIIAASVVFILVFLFLGIVIIRSISVPINNTVAMIKDIAQGEGDLTRRLEVRSRDEMGNLATWFNLFIEGMQAMVRGILDVTKNVSSTSQAVKQASTMVQESAKIQMQAIDTTSSSVEEMSFSIKNVANDLEELQKFTEGASSSSYEMSAAVQEINNHTEELATLADRMGASINQIAASIKQVASSVDTLFGETGDVSSTMMEMKKTVDDVGSYSKELASMSERVTENASTLGLSAVKKTMEGIERIRDEVFSVAEFMGKLGSMSKEIGKIVLVIDEIANTTSLLSLNAAILAAQAGDHGKGFAVVAEEVKGLADRTALSTKEIEGLIKQVLQRVAEAERSTKLGLERVEEGVQLSKAAERALTTIIESSSQSLDMAKRVERAVDEQTRGVTLVAENIQKVNYMVEEIRKASTEQSKASEDILRSTEHVRDFTRQVKKSVSQQSGEITALSKEIAEASQRMRGVSDAMGEQKKSGDNILSAIQTIVEQSGKNVRYAEELGKMVQDLEAQGGSLNKQVGKFKI